MLAGWVTVNSGTSASPFISSARVVTAQHGRAEGTAGRLPSPIPGEFLLLEFEQLRTTLTTKGADAAIYEERIRRSLNAGNVTEARRHLNDALANGVESEQVRRWKIALALPVAVVGKPGTGRGSKLIQAWLNANGAEYRGHWVVFVSGHYRLHGYDRARLRAVIEAEGQLPRATFVRIPE